MKPKGEASSFSPEYVTVSLLDHSKALQHALNSAIAWIVRDKADLWLIENGLDIAGTDVNRPVETYDRVQSMSFEILNGVYGVELNRHLGLPPDYVSVRDRMTNFERDASGIGGQRVGDFLGGMYSQAEVANFVVSSSFVRLLGAWEQFEVDVLRCLMFYRPDGLHGSPEDNELIVVNEERFNTDFGDLSHDSGVWHWMSKHAENRFERAKILNYVFGIKSESSKVENKKVEEWYAKRNRIAHGRGDAGVSFSEYIEADAQVFLRAMSVSRQCKDLQLVWL